MNDKKIEWTKILLTVIGIIATVTVSYLIYIWTNPPDFALSVSPAKGTVYTDSSTLFDIKLECLHNYQGDVILTSSGQPSGVVINFKEDTLNSGQSTTTATATVSPSVPPNTYEIAIKGTGNDGKKYSLTYFLTVSVGETISDYKLSVSPSQGSASASEVVETTLTIERINGYTQDVSLAALGQPTGVQVTFDPSAFNQLGVSRSKVTINVAAGVPPGDYEITIMGTGKDGVDKEIKYVLTVKENSPIVSITSPKDGDAVDIVVTVEGSVQNIPSGQSLWLFVLGDSRYYPMTNPVTIQASGIWSGVAYVGNELDTGKQFYICSVLANSTAESQINIYNANSKSQGYAGMEQPPAGAVIHKKVMVLRKGSSLPTATINYPVNNVTVSKIGVVRGTVKNIPSGFTVWPIVFVHSVSLYYPMPAAVSVRQDGSWETSVTFGGPSDERVLFDVIMVVADSAGHNALVAYNEDAEKYHPGDYPGIPSIPPGLTEIARVTVVRGPWT